MKHLVRLAYTPMKDLPQKHGYSHWDCVDICFHCKVITCSTSGLYLMVFSIVRRCRYRGKWIGCTRKLCCSRWDQVEMSSSRPVITTYGFGGFLLLVCICRQEKSALELLSWLHMKTLICPSDFFPSTARLTLVTLEASLSPFVSHQNFGDSNRYGKNYFGVL